MYVCTANPTLMLRLSPICVLSEPPIIYCRNYIVAKPTYTIGKMALNVVSLPAATARVFRSDSPGKAAQWLARSIRES
jgi:hypothetical protein